MVKKTTDEIVKLSDYAHHRLRTEMYLGSRNLHTQTVINWKNNQLIAEEISWTPAVYCAFREIFDNSLDEVIGHGHGSKIDVTYDPKTLTFSVADDGRGIPIDWDENERMHKATIALTQARAGRNFGERQEVRGTNGIGASVVVSCSKEFSIDIKRDGKRFQQTFKEGTDLLPDLDISEPRIFKSSMKSGTETAFTLSSTVFPKAHLPIDFVYARVYEVAANHPNIKFTFNGQKITVAKSVDKTFFSQKKPIIVSINQEKFVSNYYLIPNFADEGEFLHSTVNDIPAFNGGQHIDTFKRLFFSGILKALERESSKRGLTPNRSDIAEGLLIYNTTVMHAPNFDSQSKTRLINDEVDKYIKNTLENDITFKDIIKHNKEWIDTVYARCAARTQKKDDADVAKANRKLLRNKVPKLLDATSKERTKCILLICEGDCVAEDTEIAIFEDGKFSRKKIKDIQLGDLVLTHKGRIKPVCNKQAKITDGITITTSSGKILKISLEHKIPVYNIQLNQYEIVKGKDLDKSKHKLFSSIINMDSTFFEIISVNDFDDKKFNKSISFTNGVINQTCITSENHLFSVLNICTATIEKVAAKNLDIDIHLLMAHNLQ
jgi:DNA gyrase/topoisomerase IV subunit B